MFKSLSNSLKAWNIFEKSLQLQDLFYFFKCTHWQLQILMLAEYISCLQMQHCFLAWNKLLIIITYYTKKELTATIVFSSEKF